MRMRNDFLQLISNGLRIRRTVPAITVSGAQRVGTPPGKRILWLSNGANEDLADRARFFSKRLRQSQRCDDLAVLVPSSFKNAGNAMRLAINFKLRSGKDGDPGGQFVSNQDIR